MALDREMERLRCLPLFACLDEDALRLVAFSAESHAWPVGHILFRRDEPADSALLVAGGEVTLDSGPEGDGPLRAGPGMLVDQSALLGDGYRTATAMVTDPASVITISRSMMMRVLAAYPANAVALRRYWAARLGQRLALVRAAVRS